MELKRTRGEEHTRFEDDVRFARARRVMTNLRVAWGCLGVPWGSLGALCAAPGLWAGGIREAITISVMIVRLVYVCVLE